jgi:hypothetical protein
MRRAQRLIAGTVLIALSGALGGCAGGLGNFDPSDMLDFLDTKKKLPGDRKPVFPEGVPGLEQGVPKDLYKSEVERQQQEQAAQAAAPAAAPVEEPKGKKGRKGKSAAAGQDAAPQDGETAAVEQGAAGVPPAPKPKKIVRRRTTAPPPDDTTAQPQPAQSSGGGFPAPMPSGTFTR